MTNVPQEPAQSPNDDPDFDLQGYQDDIDTSRRDQFANEAGGDPSEDSPATRAELRQGLRDSAAPDQEGGMTPSGQDDAEPPMAGEDDYREDIEDRDEDDKERSMPGW